MCGLPWAAWIRFGIWLIVGLAIYLGYGTWRSRRRSAVELAEQPVQIGE